MNVYAPIIECSEKEPYTVDDFYNELEKVIKNVKY